MTQNYAVMLPGIEMTTNIHTLKGITGAEAFKRRKICLRFLACFEDVLRGPS